MKNYKKQQNVLQVKVKCFDASKNLIWVFFNGRRYLDNDGSQNCLIFQLIYNTFAKPVVDTYTIITSKSKGLWDEVIKPPTASRNSLAPKL